MKRIKHYARLMIFIPVIGALVFSTAFFFSRPSIHFDRMEHDFGVVPEHSEQHCEFVFHNKGSGTLIIERVSAG
jgi:hypothetical protein